MVDCTQKSCQQLVAGQWRVGKMIGEGSHGTVWSLRPLASYKVVKVAKEGASGFLEKEFEVYGELAKTHAQGFSTVHFFGLNAYGRRTPILVLDRAEYDLQHISHRCGRRLSLKSLLMIGHEMINRFEDLHCAGFIHGDVSPCNILIGKNRSGIRRKIILSDFGLSQKINCHQDSVLSDGSVIVSLFSSTNALKGCRLGPKDDIESLLYVLAFLRNGRLPWGSVCTIARGYDAEAILECRENLHSRDLFKKFPSYVIDIFNTVKSMQTGDIPNYDRLRSLFRNALTSRRLRLDFRYDWL